MPTLPGENSDIPHDLLGEKPHKEQSVALPGWHKHKIAEAFMSGHVDRRIGRHLLELEPFGGLYHL
jgi:hypothetical protein